MHEYLLPLKEGLKALLGCQLSLKELLMNPGRLLLHSLQSGEALLGGLQRVGRGLGRC